MQSRDFCYWLQGFFEIQSASESGGPEVHGISASQMSMIRNHLNMVFVHEIDPSMGDKGHQDKLNTVHGVGKPTDLIMRC